MLEAAKQMPAVVARFGWNVLVQASAAAKASRRSGYGELFVSYVSSMMKAKLATSRFSGNVRLNAL